MTSHVAVLETWPLWLAGVAGWDPESEAWVRDDDALDATTYESAFG